MFTECYIHTYSTKYKSAVSQYTWVYVLLIKEKNKSIFYEYYHRSNIKFYGKM